MIDKKFFFVSVLFFIIGIFLVNLVLAQGTDSIYTINLPGDQINPKVFGTLIIYLQDLGQGRADVHVYHSGSTLDPKDDVGVIEITKDGRDHKYSNVAIDNANGRFIVWLDDSKYIYIKDLGEDAIINTKDDKEIRKININDFISDKEYYALDNVVVSNGKIVFDAIDRISRDRDVMGFDLINNKFIAVSNLKQDSAGDRKYDVDEYDPYIVGDNVVFLRDYLVIDDAGFEIESVELYGKNFEEEIGFIPITLTSDSPITDVQYKGQKYTIELVAASDVAARIKVTNSLGNSDTLNIFEQESEKVNGVFITIKSSDENNLKIKVVLNVGDERFISQINDGCNADEPSINKENKDDIVWIGDCDPFSKVFRNGNEVDSSNEIKFNSPIVRGDDVYYTKFHPDSNEIKFGTNVVSDTKIDADLYRLVYITLGDGKDITSSFFFEAILMIGPKILYNFDADSYIYGNYKGYFISWVTDADDGIYANFLDSEGKWMFERELKIFDKSSSAKSTDHKVASLGNGVVIVVWGNQARFVKLDGSIWPTTPIELYSNPDLGGIPKVVPDGKGGAIISLKARVIYVRADGTVWPQNPIEIHKGEGSIFGHDIAPDGKGGTLFVISLFIKNKVTPLVKLLKQDGTFWPQEGIEVFAGITSIASFVIASDMKGGAIVGATDLAAERTIYLTFIDDVGNIIDSFSIDDPTNKDENIKITSDGEGGAIFYWGGNDGLYARYVNSDRTVWPLDEAILIDKNVLNLYTSNLIITPRIDGKSLLVYRNKNYFAKAYFLTSEGRVINVRLVEGEFKNARGTRFIRGDSDSNGKLDLTDAIFILNHLFQGGAEPKCFDAADVDDNGKVDITDAVRLLQFLFQGGNPPAEPYPEAGSDPSEDDLNCAG